MYVVVGDRESDGPLHGRGKGNPILVRHWGSAVRGETSALFRERGGVSIGERGEDDDGREKFVDRGHALRILT